MDSQNEGRKSNSSGNLNFVVATLVIFYFHSVIDLILLCSSSGFAASRRFSAEIVTALPCFV